MIRTIAGRGWLRTAMGSSTASYSLRLHGEGPDSDNAFVDGLLRADVSMMVEAQGSARATLVLESGRSVAVQVLDLTPDGLTVRVAQALSFWPGAGR